MDNISLSRAHRTVSQRVDASDLILLQINFDPETMTLMNDLFAAMDQQRNGYLSQQSFVSGAYNGRPFPSLHVYVHKKNVCVYKTKQAVCLFVCFVCRCFVALLCFNLL